MDPHQDESNLQAASQTTAGKRGTQVKAKGEKEDTVNCIYLSITVKKKNKTAGQKEGEKNMTEQREKKNYKLPKKSS